MNLGYGGGKPEFFLETPGLLEWMNRAELVVVQIMSARGSPTPLFRHLGVINNMVEAPGPSGARQIFVDQAYRLALRDTPWPDMLEAVSQTRQAYVASMQALLDAIRVPKLLLWFSVRAPGYSAAPGSLENLFSAYPQLVDQAVVDALRPKADAYVDCTGAAGMPFRVLHPVTGEPQALFSGRDDPSLNTYYPSQDMHDLAAEALHAEVSRILA